MFVKMTYFKKSKNTFLSIMFFGMQSVALYSMEQLTNKQIIMVYSHGFGETGGQDGPTYPDAPGKMDQAVFYTRPSVICLVTYLHYRVIEQGYIGIHLVGRSCGAGIAINCLYKLSNYDPTYFEETVIQSKDDAQKILDAINNGALELTVPFLSIAKAKIVDTATTIGGYGIATIGAGTILALTGAPALPAVALATTLYGSYKFTQVLGKLSKGISTASIDDYVVPAISQQHYDPTHIKPIDAVASLKNIRRGPILLHFCKKDGVLTNPDEDAIKVYESLRTGNEKNTYIILTDDDSHNFSPCNGQYKQLRNQFYNMVYNQGPKISGYQPTIQELRNIIFPSLWNMSFRKKDH